MSRFTVVLTGSLISLMMLVLIASCATGQSGVYTAEDAEKFDKACATMDFRNIYFETDKFKLLDVHKPALEHWTRYLNECPYVYLEIQGHCDERASYEYNMDLGVRRASSVRKYLIDAGVKPERISVVTFGEHQPDDEDHTTRAWSKNRRVEVVPKVQVKK